MLGQSGDAANFQWPCPIAFHLVLDDYFMMTKHECTSGHNLFKVGSDHCEGLLISFFEQWEVLIGDRGRSELLPWQVRRSRVLLWGINLVGLIHCLHFCGNSRSPYNGGLPPFLVFPYL